MKDLIISIVLVAAIVGLVVLWLVRSQQCAAVGREYSAQIFACVEATRPWEHP